MDVQSERRVKTLNHGHGATFRIEHTVELELDLRAPSVPAEDLTHEDVHGLRAELLVVGEQVSKPDWQGHDPLPDGDVRGKHVVDEMRGGRRHVPAAAASAPATTFATEGNQVFKSAILALNANKSSRQDSAIQK